MLKNITKLFGDSNDKELKKLIPLVGQVNALEPEFEALSDDGLKAKTRDFKQALEEDYSLDDLIPEAFAAVREAAKRTLGQRHFDVQLIGGAILHQGKIAEMRTGEGKTLVATLPAFLNALQGKGVHVVTVNDYLARRDTQWMGQIYHKLGLRVACLQHDSALVYDPTSESEDEHVSDLRPIPREQAYAADITYGTNSEFGFDYLRDNMIVELRQQVQRGLSYAIVDEVDNILVDEARTPLIISGQSADSDKQYQTFARLIPSLRKEEDYTVDEKLRTVSLTQSGISNLESSLNIGNLYDDANYQVTHYIDNALKANAIYKLDVDYVVDNGEVVLVDEFTGRLMVGRRLSDGLHQAIEAKEGVKVQKETVTLATITLQNYFRMYEKLSGMTGTAATEAEELDKIYKLDVMVVPTHKPMVRDDEQDLVFKTQDAKYNAVAEEIEEANKEGRPVLVGTVSIESSERLSDLLRRRGIRHEVLNAKQHEREASIVAEAGRIGAVTVATNMAGRGTDIVLGGARDGRDDQDWQREHDQVVQAGGLYIVGTERHEARRIDNQLRGRSGRQGDPGLSQFFVSFEDDLMRRFGGDRVKGIMEWAGVEDDAPLQHGFISKTIENAQTKVEAHNFDIRKRLIEYDDVVNKHREVIYGERLKILRGADLRANILDLVHREIQSIAGAHMIGEDAENWDLTGLSSGLSGMFPIPSDLTPGALSMLSRGEAAQTVQDHADQLYDHLEQTNSSDTTRVLERMVMLRTIDAHWIEHLTTMENTRQAIGLQGVAQIDPLVAYKRQGASMFQELSDRIQTTIARNIYHATVGQTAQLAQGTARTQRAAVRVSPHQQGVTAAGGGRAGPPGVPPDPTLRQNGREGEAQAGESGAGESRAERRRREREEQKLRQRR